LIALVLRTGNPGESALDVARGLLCEAGSFPLLARRGPAELTRRRGIGRAKAAALAAAFELSRRFPSPQDQSRTVFRGPADVARHIGARLRDRTEEVFVVLVLDAKNALVAEVELSRGILNASLVHPREVFKAAIDHRGASVIVLHNHPSGNAEPSSEDQEITRQLADAGRIVGIPVHDHVIVAGSEYRSMAELGFLENPGQNAREHSQKSADTPHSH
jgi:DNA repair protein RadC